MMVWRIFKFIEHQFYRGHIQGRRLHSPYLFEFVHDVIFNAHKQNVPGNVLAVHRNLHRDRTMIPVYRPGEGTASKVDRTRKGAGSSVDTAQARPVRSFVRGSSVSRKYGALLYRITHWFRPDVIIELGTGLGVSTCYLAAGSPGSPLHTIEGNPDRAEFSEALIKRCGMDGVKVHRGGLDKKLMEIIPDLEGRIVAFVDGNHRFGPTIGYIRTILEIGAEEGVIIMDDIYWSKGMQRAWKEVISWPEVRVSIDLFQMGILLLRKDLYKTALKVKF